MLIKTVFLIYAVLYFIILVNKEKTQSSENTIYVDITRDTNPIDLNPDNFMFAIKLKDENNTLIDFDIIDSTYKNSLVQHSVNTKTEEHNKTYFQLVHGDMNFPLSDKEKLKEWKIEDYYCPPSDFNVQVMGNETANIFKYLEILVAADTYDFPYKTEGDETHPDYDPYYHWCEVAFQIYDVIVLNRYFDFEDYENPIKEYIQKIETYDVGVSEGDSVMRYDAYIQENKFSLFDSVFSVSPYPTEGTFIHIEDTNTDYSWRDGYNETKYRIFSFIFHKNEYTNSYEREVFTILEYFGQIGGLFEVMKEGGSMLVNFFAGKMFLLSLISNLFQVKQRPTQRDVDKSNQNSQENQMEGGKEEFKNNENKEKISISHESSNHRENADSNRVIRVAKDNMKARFRYQWKISDFFLAIYHLSPTKWILSIFGKCTSKLARRRYKMLKEGSRKQKRELDIVKLVKSLRTLEAITKALLSENQQKLIEYQHSNLLGCEDDSNGVKVKNISSHIPKENGQINHREHSQSVDGIFENMKDELKIKENQVLLKSIGGNGGFENSEISINQMSTSQCLNIELGEIPDSQQDLPQKLITPPINKP